MKRRAYALASVSAFVVGAAAHLTASAWRLTGRILFDLHDVCAHEARREREMRGRARR